MARCPRRSGECGSSRSETGSRTPELKRTPVEFVDVIMNNDWPE
jgi:hypothetical protein